jgi:hypothetical protein
MSKVESADLILKLYDLRREPKMREARSWIFSFNPQNADEYIQTMRNPEVGALLRMVTSYWDMAAALVVHGAIDAEMFADTAGEHIIIYAKIQPFLEEFREKIGNPKAFGNLEKVIFDMPDGRERVERAQAMLRSFAEKKAEEAAA